MPGRPTCRPGSGQKIVIIGAGIAGMVLAWELRKAGYAPTILEARPSPGGRNWSLRAGDEIRETGSVQRVRWDAGEHLYFNPGPARLPYHHQGILSYCRELGVALEVMCNDNRGALLHDDAAFDGKPQRNRQVVNDIRGYIAELAAKAVDQDALDAAGRHRGQGAHPRASCAPSARSIATWPTRAPAAPAMPNRQAAAPRKARRSEPLDLRAILAASFWEFETNFGEGWHQAATMMQPVGGMGRIGQAFGQKLGADITYNAEVTRTAPCGKRCARRVEGHEDRRQARDRGAARRGHHPAAGAAHDPRRLLPRKRALRSSAVDYIPAVQDRVPGRAPVLGAG